MKRKIVPALRVFVILAILILTSCQKELECPNCPAVNQPPVAKAGPDLTITLPTDSVTLNGFQSYDPGGSITQYLWTKISGPALFAIMNPDSVITQLKSLDTGTYSFELRVTDNGGLIAKDTVSVTVNAAGHTNRSPVAKAGADQVIELPDSTAIIDGSDSYDSDGSIVAYSWNQVVGPNQSAINNSSQISAEVNNLVQGTYQFVLEVTDNGGLKAKDTVIIIVNVPIHSCFANRPFVNARLVSVGTLSEARLDISCATAGNKILFAGGLKADNFVSSRVDIYDYVTNTWSTAELSKARHNMTVASLGNKIFFAGGVNQWNAIRFTDVDIYDALTNTWSTANLSEGRGYLASASLGDKVFFAGGWYWYNQEFFMNHVDIYNNATNTWTTASLSEGRAGLTATAIGNKIYFAGGNTIVNPSNKIDIYDGTSNSWSTSTMSEEKSYFGSIASSNKIYWAGGVTSFSPNQIFSSQVEIKDISTGVSTITCLSQEKASFRVVSKGNDIVFFTGFPNDLPNYFDIHNSLSGTWSIGRLDEALSNSGVISANNKIYVAGGASFPNGALSNKVSLLEW